MRPAGKTHIRLIEADMSVTPNPQKLQINPTMFHNNPVIPGTFQGAVSLGTVRQENISWGNIDVVKKMLSHEPTIALRIAVRQATVFIQIDRNYPAEIHISLFIPVN